MATTLYRPNAAGDSTQLTAEPVGSNYTRVDEAVIDVDDYVEETTLDGITYDLDLYNLEPVTLTGSVVTIRVRATLARLFSPSGTAKLAIKTGGTIYYGTEITNISVGVFTYSYNWNTNPKTGHSWTETELSALQAGLAIKGLFSNDARCYQLWLEVVDLSDFNPIVPSLDTFQSLESIIIETQDSLSGVLTMEDS